MPQDTATTSLESCYPAGAPADFPTALFAPTEGSSLVIREARMRQKIDQLQACMLDMPQADTPVKNTFSGGNEAEARSSLAQLSRDLRHLIPGLERITAAQLQTAQAQHLTESTIARVLGKAAEHPNTPANDHAAPSEPAPFIA